MVSPKDQIAQARSEGYKEGWEAGHRAGLSRVEERVDAARSDGWERGRKQGEAEGRIAAKGDAHHKSMEEWKSGYDKGYADGKKAVPDRYTEGKMMGVVIVLGIITVGMVAWASFAAMNKWIEVRNERSAFEARIEEAQRNDRKWRDCRDRWKGYAIIWNDRQQLCSVRIWPDSEAYIPEDKIHVGAEPPWKK